MLKNRVSSSRICFFIVIVFLMIYSAAFAEDGSLNCKVKRTIEAIKTARSSDTRDLAAEKLASLMTGIDPKSIDTKTVDELVSLLKNPHYDVRVWVTVALGQLGRKAKTPDAALNRKLEEQITLARTGKSQTERMLAGEEVCLLLNGTDPKYVSDKTITDMISLLDSPYDSVRGSAAGALGIMGPRSKAAIPKLLALLPAADCLKGDLTSAGSIRLALERMGVEPPPFDPTKCK